MQEFRIRDVQLTDVLSIGEQVQPVGGYGQNFACFTTREGALVKFDKFCFANNGWRLPFWHQAFNESYFKKIIELHENDQPPQIAGCILAKYNSHGYVYISSLSVHPEYRRQGLASELLSFLAQDIMWWRQANPNIIKRVNLHVDMENIVARQLYANLGFQDIELECSKNNPPQYSMFVDPNIFYQKCMQRKQCVAASMLQSQDLVPLSPPPPPPNPPQWQRQQQKKSLAWRKRKFR